MAKNMSDPAKSRSQAHVPKVRPFRTKESRSRSRYEDVPPERTRPPTGILYAGYFLTRFGYRTFRANGAGSWLLFFTEGGEGLIQQPGVSRSVRTGDVDLLAPDAYSDYGVPPPTGAQAKRKSPPFDRLWERVGNQKTRIPRDGWLFHWIHFHSDDRWAGLLDWPEVGKGWGRDHIRRRSARRRIGEAFLRIHRDLTGGGATAQRLAASALEEILVLIVRETGRTEKQLDARIQEALEIIQRDPGTPHSVEALAKCVNLSPSRFAHLFKEEAGTSVTQAVNRVRIKEAQKLLSCTSERISEIAALLGFGSPFYFSRQFAAQTGLSPRDYRRRATTT